MTLNLRFLYTMSGSVMMRAALTTVILMFILVSSLFGQKKENQTYRNPILPGDFQNTDVIRVGGTYYYISATKELSPGMLVMSSNDLVNWRPIGHAVSDITQISSRYNYDRMEGAARGIWAGAIRYHKKRFYIYFTDPDEGLFMTTATNPAGPWAPLTAIKKAAGWDDPCPFWDEDGKAYLVITNFADNYKIHLFRMSEDGKTIDLKSDQVIHQSRGSEANKLYKIKGYYYHFYSEVTADGRLPFMARSQNIYGPYSQRRQLIHKSLAEPNQGGLVQTPKGDWYFVTHHGQAYWSGREVSLLPVTWTDDWPVWGTVGQDGIGNMVWSAKKPIADMSQKLMQTSDDFNKATLSPQWEWYFQPRSDKWSLQERPGYLRLYACRPISPGTITKTTNVLTQRPLRVHDNVVEIKMDVSNLVHGQAVALSLFGKTAGSIGIKQTNNIRNFYADELDVTTNGPALPALSKVVWLRASWDISGKTHFEYSMDGIQFSKLGNEYQITNFGNFLGAKIGIYTVNDSVDQGFVDIDWFHYKSK